MRPGGLGGVVSRVLFASLLVVPVLAALDVLLTALALPLARTEVGPLASLVLDTVRYWVIGAIVFAPVTVALAFAFRRVSPEHLLSWALATSTGASVAFSLLAAFDPYRLEFFAILHLYQFGVLLVGGLVTLAVRLLLPWLGAVVGRVLPALAGSRAIAVALSVFAGVTGVGLAHGVAAPIYQVSLALLLGLGGLSCATALLAAWALPERKWPALAAVVGCVVLVVSWPFGSSPRARFVLHGHTAVASAVGVFWREFSDFDRDGSTAWYWGGNDCAPHDGSVSPLHIEVPGDGIDQDCRGGDAALGVPLAPARLAPSCGPRARTHVVLLTIDALRADRVRSDRMPALATLAKGGLWYRRAYPPAGSTAGTLLGTFSGSPLSDLNPVSLFGEEVRVESTFVEALRGLGYSTALYNPFDLHPRLWSGVDTTAVALDAVPHVTKQRRLARTLLSAVFARLAGEDALGHPAFVGAHLPDLHAPYLLADDQVGHHPYDDLAASVDGALEEFLVALRQSPLWERTLLIVTADHGEQLGERGREGHGTLFFEEGIRVPLVLHVPGCPAAVVDEPVSLLSLREFVERFAHAGVGTSGGPDERSPHLAHSSAPARPSAPVVVEEAQLSPLGLKRAAIGGRFKLIEDLMNGGRVAFDLDTDPYETTDILPARGEELAPLLSAYQAWRDARRQPVSRVSP